MTQNREDATLPGAQRCVREAGESGDLVERRIAWLVWGLPKAILVLGAFWSEARVWLWTPALLVAGTACLMNAARCGRLHCYFTGPLYLLAALATVLSGLHIVPLHWGWILGAVVGGMALAYVLEVPLGKYVKRA